MGGQRAEDERDGTGVGLEEADARRGERFVGDEVAGGGAGVGARTAARADAEVVAEAVPAGPMTPTVPAAGSGPDSESPAADTTSDAGPDAKAATETADPAVVDPFPFDLTDSQILGRQLALARQHAGLSLEEVVAATRIRPGMLREIEAGDFVHCGGDVYARGHVRAIAKVVGIDPEPLLAEHPPVVPLEPLWRHHSRVGPRTQTKAASQAETPKAARQSDEGAAPGKRSAPASNAVPTSAARDSAARFSGRAPSRVIRPAAGGATLVPAGAAAGRATAAGGKGTGSIRPPQPSRRNDPGKIERNPKSANWSAAMLVALLGLVVFAGVQLIGDGGGKPAAAALPTAPAPKPVAVKPPPPLPPPVPPVPPAPKGVAVKFAAVGSASWLHVISADGKVLFDNLLPAGGTQSFQDANQLGVTFGNASAVHMTLNGKDLGPAGGDGQVLHVTLNPTGVVSG